MKAYKMSKSVGECVYCGVLGPVTDDHVPPRSFYPAIPPKNLITVPSCEPCNIGFSKEDDYVRLVLAVNEHARGNSDRNEILPAVKRFAEHRRSKNVLSKFYRSLEVGLHQNPQGLYIWAQHFRVEMQRLDRFATRVVKALFFREKGYRLPDFYKVNAIHHSRFAALAEESDDYDEFLMFIITQLREQSERRAWGQVFGYSWVQSPNNSDQTWWLLDFYGATHYLCSTWNVTAPAGRVE
jgi:5-methylcytosine-specific restriction endonuclease McrA